jgi:Co/Zn/Cd efflux system component
MVTPAHDIVVKAIEFCFRAVTRHSTPMSDSCSHLQPAPGHLDPRYRRVLWVALVLNAAMFVVEIAAGVRADSVSLLADAVDFFGDALNYGLALAVLGAALTWRARVAGLKGASMVLFGLWVLGLAAWNLWHGVVPEARTMGLVGALALVVNVAVAVMLYAFREGDANMRSVWLCTRNDAIGNLAVLAAALGVFGTGQGWPDLVVASIMGGLALGSGTTVLRQARRELQAEVSPR